MNQLYNSNYTTYQLLHLVYHYCNYMNDNLIITLIITIYLLSKSPMYVVD